MHRRTLPLLLALAVVLPASAGAFAASLEAEVELAIAAAGLGGAGVGVSVLEAGPGTALVAVNAETLMIPASNMKLVTTGAALHTLGPDFRFQTRLLREGDRLVVVGDGDPAFGDPALLATMTAADGGTGLDVDEFLDLWLDAAVATGIERFSEVLVDDRIFDREFVHATWPRDQLNRRYCAQVSGLGFHLNQIHFYPDPRRDQRPSLYRFVPRTSRLKIENNATSRMGPHDGNTAWISRRLGTNDLTFYGNVKHRYRAPVPVTLHDMATFFGELLAERLRQRGVEVDAVRLVDRNRGPSTGEAVGPVIYTPIGTVVTRCNRDSQNLYAECLLKRMGHALTGEAGSWLNGASIARHVVYERLKSANVASRVVIRDGSGLSRENRIAPATLTAWLNSFHNDELLAEPFVDSLAIAGRNGTLRKRLTKSDLRGAVVQAKSGYINGVSCLAGYVTMPDGRRRCFSVMVNDIEVPVRLAKALQDRVVEAIARSMAPEPVAQGSD
jgi:D-alanyl-D-alanine carboxypeptidase/D-alanyl-D-alanine-endopeptidase (penicillin-binding protein 4)